MKKKLVFAFILTVILVAFFYMLKFYRTTPKIPNTPEVLVEASTSFEDEVYEYEAGRLPKDCRLTSEMACAVDFAIKCTLEPDYEGCRASKLPKFIFMSDEALQRPTQMSFKITKIKPIAADMVEMYTQSSCNGNWFGLCQGTVIYVLIPDGETWRVKDIYAIES